jgi:hypothetical protein
MKFNAEHKDIMITCMDGIVFGDCHGIVAIGMERWCCNGQQCHCWQQSSRSGKSVALHNGGRCNRILISQKKKRNLLKRRKLDNMNTECHCQLSTISGIHSYNRDRWLVTGIVSDHMLSFIEWMMREFAQWFKWAGAKKELPR